jgi:hypothetical protein
MGVFLRNTGRFISLVHNLLNTSRRLKDLRTDVCVLFNQLLLIPVDYLTDRLLSKNIKIRICKTLILPVFLYGCQTWSLTLREEHRLRVFENRVLREYLVQRDMK